MVGHKISRNKFKKIEIISSIFSDHDDLKLDTNLKKKTQKHSNTWNLNRMLLNNDYVNKDFKEDIKTFLEKMNTQPPQTIRYSESCMFIVLESYL